MEKGVEPLDPSKFTKVLKVCAGEAIAVAARSRKTLQAFFNGLSLVIGNPPWCEFASRGLFTREKPSAAEMGDGASQPGRGIILRARWEVNRRKIQVLI